MKKLDIILQGPYTDFTDVLIQSYLNLDFINKIIISCWEGDVISTNRTGEVIVKNKDEPYQHEKVECVKSINDLYYSGVLNVNYQLKTSLAGLQKSDQTFCAVMRSDTVFTLDSMKILYDFFIENIESNTDSSYSPKGKIFILGNNIRYLFHPNNWIFWGYREDLLNLFDIPYQVNEECMRRNINKDVLYYHGEYFRICYRPETYKGANYCAQYDSRVAKMVESPELYLYDDCPNISESHAVSLEVMPKLFKSFPGSGIDYSCPKNNIMHRQPISEEVYHEDGM